MKAIHKYKQAAQQGDKEAQRRVAQSMGYKHSIFDDTKMMALLYRAGIEIAGIDYVGETNTQFTGVNTIPSFGTPDNTTIKL